MFGPGRHFPPAELREWERGERLDPEYQLSAKPPSPAQPSPASLPAPAQKSRSAFLQREEEEKEEEERAGRRGEGMGGRESQKCQWAWDWREAPPKAFISGHPNGTSRLGCGDPEEVTETLLREISVVQSGMFAQTGVGRSTKLLQ